jgi:hypothetical protein
VQFFTSGNMIVAAAGVPLGTAESLAAEFLAELPARPATPQPASRYVGGGSVEHTPQGATALVAFESEGWQAMDASIVSTVVRFCLPPLPPSSASLCCTGAAHAGGSELFLTAAVRTSAAAVGSM